MIGQLAFRPGQQPHLLDRPRPRQKQAGALDMDDAAEAQDDRLAVGGDHMEVAAQPGEAEQEGDDEDGAKADRGRLDNRSRRRHGRRAVG